MFTSGMSDQGRIFFSFMTFLVAVPSGVKVFNWLASMYGGAIRLEPPMVMVMMFIWLFSVGGLSGLFLGSLSADIHLHDTSFVVGHFHYVMFGGGALATFAAMHYWFPKMFGRIANRRVAHLSAILFFVGFNATYLPLKLAGVMGMPRRYADYLPEYTPYHIVSTIGSWVMVAGLILMFVNLAVGMLSGEKAGRNPWGGATLEWQILSPPPVHNFDRPPDLTRQAYDYPEVVQP
jgi:cytochrome c oxidase subunit 1